MTSAAAPIGRDVAAGADADVRSPACAPPSASRSEVEQPSGILREPVRRPRGRHGQQLAARGDRARACPSGVSRRSASSSELAVQQQQLAVGEPAEVARVGPTTPVSTRAISGALRSASTHVVDLVAVLVDRVALGRREDHVQLIEAAEAREEVRNAGMTRPSCGSSDSTSASNVRRRMPSTRRNQQRRPRRRRRRATPHGDAPTRRCAETRTSSRRARLCYIRRPTRT